MSFHLRFCPWSFLAGLVLGSVSFSGVVFAQTVTLSDSSPLGAARCASGDHVQVNFAAQAELSASTPEIQLFATQSDCPSPESTATRASPPPDAIRLVDLRSMTSADETGNSVDLGAHDLALGDCSVQVERTWNVCFYEFWLAPATTTSSATETHTSSQAQIVYDAVPPGPPVLTTVNTGDQHLSVGFDAPGDNDVADYRVRLSLKDTDLDEQVAASARDAGSGTTAYDCYDKAQEGDVGSSKSARVPASSETPLTDGLTYVVQVRAVDTAGNVGPCSNPVDGTPQTIDDFWRSYRQSNGGESGCSSATSDVGIFPLLCLLAIRPNRRRMFRRRRSLVDRAESGWRERL
jgi:hypothetical protein